MCIIYHNSLHVFTLFSLLLALRQNAVPRGPLLGVSLVEGFSLDQGNGKQGQETDLGEQRLGIVEVRGKDLQHAEEPADRASGRLTAKPLNGRRLGRWWRERYHS